MNGPRWKLKHLAIAIAALAVAFSAFGVEATFVLLVLCLPVIFAPKGRRIAILYWVATCYPIALLCSLYFTWFAAWLTLGHPPRPSLDDPKDIGQIEIPYRITAILTFGIPLALIYSLCLAMVRAARRPAPWSGFYLLYLIGTVPSVWIASYFLLVWDPRDVLNWYLD